MKKRIISCTMILLLLLSLTFDGITINAADNARETNLVSSDSGVSAGDYYYSTQSLTIWHGIRSKAKFNTFFLEGEDFYTNGEKYDVDELDSLSCSNSKVVSVSRSKHGGDAIIFKVKKPGTAVITYTVTGKHENYDDSTKTVTKTNKIILHAYKYSNPFKSFKLNNQNGAKKFRYYNTVSWKVKKNKKTKIAIKLNSGWKKLKIKYYDRDTRKYKTLKNNKSYKLKKYDSLHVFAYNKKAKHWYEVRIFL